MAIHHDPPEGVRRRSRVQGGVFAGVKDRRMVMRVSAPGREDEVYYVEQDADQPAFTTRERDGSV